MTIKQAYYLNWLTDIILTTLFLPFIIVFIGVGEIVKAYDKIKRFFGRLFLGKVTNITYDTEEQREEIVDSYNAKEIYVLIKDHLNQKEKDYKKTFESVDKILNGAD